MPSPVKVLIDMKFKEYQDLPRQEKMRVDAIANSMARDRGYTNLRELEGSSPGLYKQIIADAMERVSRKPQKF